ncbi:hypothetical protein [Actinomadura oligospora]|uniref:hypothetical protein n=1 Tax=Actinomadura oligospora TaxID=111804 RepID=UPI0004B62303|nr:hypothetical protein [Actinomadura oligospora]
MKMASRVGRDVARQYPGIEAEDIASEAVTRFLEKAKRIGDAEAAYVYRVLERDAAAYAAKLRYDYVISTSQYVYTPREVRALLAEVYFDASAWDVPTGKDDWLSAEIEGRSIGISLMDLRVGMDRIKPEYRSILERRFYHGDDSMHRKDVTRAIDALTRAVNRIAARIGRSDEGPGSRTVISNAKAQHITENQHDGEWCEEDALSKVQKLRKQDRWDVPGRHFNWDKYKETM